MKHAVGCGKRAREWRRIHVLLGAKYHCKLTLCIVAQTLHHCCVNTCTPELVRSIVAYRIKPIFTVLESEHCKLSLCVWATNSIPPPPHTHNLVHECCRVSERLQGPERDGQRETGGVRSFILPSRLTETIIKAGRPQLGSTQKQLFSQLSLGCFVLNL